jgi:putative ATPase
MKQEGYGGGYRYAHDYPGNFAEQEFLPEGLEGTAFYQPGANAREEEIRRRLRRLWGDRYGY